VPVIHGFCRSSDKRILGPDVTVWEIFFCQTGEIATDIGIIQTLKYGPLGKMKASFAFLQHTQIFLPSTYTPMYIHTFQGENES
jgi:hypothetical protein